MVCDNQKPHLKKWDKCFSEENQNSLAAMLRVMYADVESMEVYLETNKKQIFLQGLVTGVIGTLFFMLIIVWVSKLVG